MLFDCGDLHTHSLFSDGSYSPKTLAKLMSNYYGFFSLTDHNSFLGLKELLGKDLGIIVVPGVEVEADLGECLGYFPLDTSYESLDSSPIGEALYRIREAKLRKCELTVNRLVDKYGFNLSFDELIADSRGECINAFNIAAFIVKSDNHLSLDEVFSEVRAVGKEVIFVKERMKYVIKLISDSGGVPVLAHPWRDDYESMFNLMPELLSAGLRGIEYCSNFFGCLGVLHLVQSTIIKLSNRYNLLLTRGSDFHSNSRGLNLLGNKWFTSNKSLLHKLGVL